MFLLFQLFCVCFRGSCVHKRKRFCKLFFVVFKYLCNSFGYFYGYASLDEIGFAVNRYILIFLLISGEREFDFYCFRLSCSLCFCHNCLLVIVEREDYASPPFND